MCYTSRVREWYSNQDGIPRNPDPPRPPSPINSREEQIRNGVFISLRVLVFSQLFCWRTRALLENAAIYSFEKNKVASGPKQRTKKKIIKFRSWRK